MTFTIAGELASGTSLADRARWEEFFAPFQVLTATDDVSGATARSIVTSSGTGCSSAATTWIAATAVANEMPLVTRNHLHFSRVPGIEVVAYGG